MLYETHLAKDCFVIAFCKVTKKAKKYQKVVDQFEEMVYDKAILEIG